MRIELASGEAVVQGKNGFRYSFGYSNPGNTQRNSHHTTTRPPNRGRQTRRVGIAIEKISDRHEVNDFRISSSSSPTARSAWARNRSTATRISEFSVMRAPRVVFALLRRRAWRVSWFCWSSLRRVSLRTYRRYTGKVGSSPGRFAFGFWTAGLACDDGIATVVGASGTAGSPCTPLMRGTGFGATGGALSPTLPSSWPRFARAIIHRPEKRWPRWTSALKRPCGSRRSTSPSAGTPDIG